MRNKTLTDCLQWQDPPQSAFYTLILFSLTRAESWPRTTATLIVSITYYFGCFWVTDERDDFCLSHNFIEAGFVEYNKMFSQNLTLLQFIIFNEQIKLFQTSLPNQKTFNVMISITQQSLVLCQENKNILTVWHGSFKYNVGTKSLL